MPRHQRVSPDGFVQHVLNRGDHRETIFHKPADFRAFLALVAEAAYRTPIRILAYCIMRNHFHLVVWPFEGRDLPRYMQLLMNLHIQRYLRHYRPASPGHLYQGRYTNSLVESDRGLLGVVRYVEANALSAKIVTRAEHYKWSSASPHAGDPSRPTLAAWPVAKPQDWLTFVNSPMPVSELKQIQASARRGSPYGSEEWTQAVVSAHKLEHTMRPRGRPKIYEAFLPTADDTTQI
jgi:putative transposase